MHLPDLHYECVHCGYSCQDLDVEITVEEAARLNDLVGDVAFEEKKERLWLRKGCDGCSLLSSEFEQGRCTLHRQHGLMSKPRACREFPFRTIVTPGGAYLGASFACRAIATRAGPAVTAETAETRALAFPEWEMSPGVPFDWPRYLSWETRVRSALLQRGEIGLWGISLELGSELLDCPVGPPTVAMEEGLWSLFRGLLALAEGSMEEETLLAFLNAHQSKGRYFSHLTEAEVNVGAVLARWENPWSMWPRVVPFFEHLLFRKYLLEGPDVYSRICSLPVMAQLLQFLVWSRAGQTADEEDLLWALRILEERLTFHSRGLERYLGKFGALFLQGLAEGNSLTSSSPSDGK